jgi:hypothetical protein
MSAKWFRYHNMAVADSLARLARLHHVTCGAETEGGFLVISDHLDASSAGATFALRPRIKDHSLGRRMFIVFLKGVPASYSKVAKPKQARGF